jgi:catechol 2,3-dioxygenase-like lactoylglutathione lyase family enzyme
MFSHIMIGSNDIARSKKFYDALFAAMGAPPGVEDARGRLAYSHNGGRFMVCVFRWKMIIQSGGP